MSKVIDGNLIAENIKNNIKDIITTMQRKPGLGIILVGEKEDSKIYVKMKHNACKKVGINNYDVYLPEESSEKTVLEAVQKK